MAEELTIFKSVHTISERQRLFGSLLGDKGTLYLKDKFDRSLPLKALSVDSRFYLKCTPPTEEGLNLNPDETYTAVFWIDSEKYLFETRPELIGGFMILPVMSLFHLQKRRTFRYLVPEDYTAHLNMTSLNRTACEFSCRLIDLSSQGCAVEVGHDVTDIHLEDIFEAEITLEGHKTIKVQGVVKNIRERGDHQLVLGVEFHHMAHSSEENINNSISDLQRELFYRRAAA